MDLDDVPGPRVKPGYEDALKAVAPVLLNRGSLVAIDGLPGSGKSTFARFLAWRVNVALVETDLFLIRKRGSLVYRMAQLADVIGGRLDGDRPRSLIVEGVVVQRVLRDLGRQPDFVVRVTNPDAPDLGSLKEEVLAYERDHLLSDRAALVLKLNGIS